VEGGLIYEFGYCGTPLVPPSLQHLCNEGVLTFEDIMMSVFPKYLSVPFAYIQVRFCVCVYVCVQVYVYV
jgi:hypothetical protein